MASLIPKHVAIIMDGNGRWAQKHARPRIFGHIRGCANAREVIREAGKLGIKTLTLFAFSSENWGRPQDEVGVLMRLLKKWLERRLQELLENDIRFEAIGAIEKLPREVQEVIRNTERLTQNNKGLHLVFALSYGARSEIIQAVRKISKDVADGRVQENEINEDLFSKYLLTANIGDPDLLIRTSGEQRISNFMLWQIAYTEVLFIEKPWPEFYAEDLRSAVANFKNRERRFGLTSAQITADISFQHI